MPLPTYYQLGPALSYFQGLAYWKWNPISPMVNPRYWWGSPFFNLTIWTIWFTSLRNLKWKWNRNRLETETKRKNSGMGTHWNAAELDHFPRHLKTEFNQLGGPHTHTICTGNLVFGNLFFSLVNFLWWTLDNTAENQGKLRALGELSRRGPEENKTGCGVIIVSWSEQE